MQMNSRFLDRYIALGHAVQTGIAWKLQLDHPDCASVNLDPNLREHKHLRVGIDLSKSDHSALAKLLIEKGIFSEEEYFAALIEGLEKEVVRYEEELSKRVGKSVKLI